MMGKIRFEEEHLDYYDGQNNYELGVYEDDEIVGYVSFVIFDNEITVSDILVRPNSPVRIKRRAIKPVKLSKPKISRRKW